MSREPVPAPRPPRTPGAGWGLSPLALLALLLGGSAALGLAVAARPGLFHLDRALEPASLAALLAGGLLAVLVVRRPGAGLVLLAVFVWLNLSEVLVRYHDLPSLLQLLVVPLALAAWLEGRVRGVGRVLALPLTVAVAGYALLLLVSTLWARDVDLADAEVVAVAKATVLYLLFALLATSRHRLRLAVWAMVGAGALLATLGAYQVAAAAFDSELGGLARIKQAQIYGDVFELRIAGPLGDPNFFAQILLVLVPLALALAWTAPRRAPRLAAYGAAALLVTGTVLTYSRGAALALAAVVALSLLAHGVRPREVGAGALLVVLVLALAPEEFTRRLTTLEEVLPWSEQTALHPDSSFEERRLVTGAAWAIFLDHPLAGVGAGNYTVRFPPYGDRVGSTARQYEEPFGDHYPHSLYLEILAETGLAGLVAFGLVVMVSLMTLESARRRLLAAGDGATAVLARGTEIALLGYLLSSLFLHGHFLRYLWLLLALAAALGLLASRGGETAQRREEVS